jgi:hypothetical protein
MASMIQARPWLVSCVGPEVMERVNLRSIFVYEYALLSIHLVVERAKGVVHFFFFL